MKTIFRFRQDLRIRDNLGFQKAVQESKSVLPIFVIDQELQKKFGKDDPRFSFIFATLTQLDKELKKLDSKLHIFVDKPVELLPRLVQKLGIQKIIVNEAYDFYGINRDKEIKLRCEQNGVEFESVHDYLLVHPSTIKPYKVFTPYFRQRENFVSIPKTIKIPQFKTLQLSPDLEKSLSKIPPISHPSILETRPIDGRQDRFQNFNFQNYENTRNFPYLDGSSKLSVYLRFGLISVRELYFLALSKNAQTYIGELAWRDFWHQIHRRFPEARFLEFQEKKRGLQRENDQKLFQKFCDAETGYPIIDASIRQLKTEFRMHNRQRMVVASFLIKDLLIDRRWGEEFFSKYLLDYDENMNIGNRQRSASVGADPKPMRIFSPIRQSERFDPEAKFITKYIPELKKHLPRHIHDPLSFQLDYFPPIVDHKIQVAKAKQIYWG